MSASSYGSQSYLDSSDGESRGSVAGSVHHGGTVPTRVAFVGSVRVITGGVWSFGSAAGHCHRAGSRGKQSVPSGTPSPSVSALKGSVPIWRSTALGRPSPSMSGLEQLSPAAMAAPSGNPSPFVSGFMGSQP